MHLVSRVGRTLPAYATSLGKALLAELTEAELTGLLPQSLAPLTENDHVPGQAALAVVRERGYALPRPTCAVGSPSPGSSGGLPVGGRRTG
jgi:IclR family acetate operon transcriptional repressor